MRLPILLTVLGGVLGCGAEQAQPPAPPPATGPNVLLVCLDTFRADHLGILGYERETAPFLAELAAGGTLFEGACSTSSWTAPATASLLTGLYPTSHGVVRGFHAQRRSARKQAAATLGFSTLPADVTTLPELFQRAGYTTYGIATNLNIGPEIGFERGFERLETHDGWSAEEVRARLAEWRAELEAAAPWFLYLHLNDTHQPYELRRPWFHGPPGRGLERERALYDSEIGYLDEQLRLVFEELGIDDDTLVAVVADHGEEFMEHGRRSHGMSLHGELNRSLFFVRAPGLGVAAQRVAFPVSLVDVGPTLLELAGAPPFAGDGASLAALARGGPAGTLKDRTVFAHRVDPFYEGPELWAAVRGRWKIIADADGVQLFDVLEDPGEHRDVAAEHPEQLAALVLELERFRAGGVRSDGPNATRELDAELLERLEELGYTE